MLIKTFVSLLLAGMCSAQHPPNPKGIKRGTEGILLAPTVLRDEKCLNDLVRQSSTTSAIEAAGIGTAMVAAGCLTTAHGVYDVMVIRLTSTRIEGHPTAFCDVTGSMAYTPSRHLGVNTSDEPPFMSGLIRCDKLFLITAKEADERILKQHPENAGK